MRESKQSLEEDAIKEEALWQGTAQALHASAAEAGLPPAVRPAAATTSSARPAAAATTSSARPAGAAAATPAWPWKQPEWYDLDSEE